MRQRPRDILIEAMRQARHDTPIDELTAVVDKALGMIPTTDHTDLLDHSCSPTRNAKP